MKKRLRKSPRPKRKTPLAAGAMRFCGKPLEERKCRYFCQLTSDLILVFKADGHILDANPAWCRALEYTGRNLPKLAIDHWIHAKDKKESLEIFLAVLRDGKPRKYQATFLRRDGEEIRVEGTVSRLLRGGRPYALCGIFHDVTHAEHYEHLKDEFISTVSHELRTPLTVVREGVAQLRDGLLGPVPDQQKVLLDMVLQNSDRLARIIEELLDVSRLEAGQIQLHRKRCDMVELIREVVENFRILVKRKHLEILTDFSRDAIHIYIDREKIIQVVNHLIHNALKFTEDGHIKIQVRILEGFVECKISDTGRGISAVDLPHAFQDFSQFEREIGPGDQGTGLGLSICKRLVELHHGRIKIESVPQKGTTTTFLLPLYSHRELFKDTIEKALSRCAEKGSPLSIIIFDIVDFEALEKRLGIHQAERIVLKMEEIINEALRRVVDVARKDTKAIMVLLPDTPRESAFIVLGRLSQILEDYLAHEQKTPGIELHSSVVSYPQEAKTLAEILDKIYASWSDHEKNTDRR